MLTSDQLKQISTEARPIIERMLDDADVLAGMRELVSGNGGDWSALKALIKAQIKDERDDAGDGKNVRKILEKAGRQRVSEDMDDHKALMDEAGAAGLLSPEQVAENKRLADAVARKFGNGPLPDHDPLTGEIIEHEPEPILAQVGEADPGATSVQPQVRAGLSVTQSTAARKDVPHEAGDGVGESLNEPAQALRDTEAGTQAPPVDTHGLAEPACAHDDAAANTKSAPVLSITSGGTPVQHQGLVS